MNSESVSLYNRLANGRPIENFNDSNRADCLVEFDQGKRAEILYPDAVRIGREKVEGK